VWFNVGIQEYNKEAKGVSAWKWDAETDTVIPAIHTEDGPQNHYQYSPLFLSPLCLPCFFFHTSFLYYFMFLIIN